MALLPFDNYYRPWREMARLRRDLNRLFAGPSSGFGERAAAGYPAMNVWTNEDGAILTAELPGVNPEDIDVTAEGDTLTLTGSRQAEELPEGASYHRRERSHGRFSRIFRLPFPIASDKVEAVFDKGVLRITLPRPEQDKPKKIAVKAG